MEDKSYQPIFVDTYYEYELDMSLFPGINDPSAHMQPTLLTHQEENCLCKDIPDLPSLIESCIDLECSETDSFIDDLLDDSESDLNVSKTTSTKNDSATECSISTYSDSENTRDVFMKKLPLEEEFTPDLTTSLRNVEEQNPERITLSQTDSFRKGTKRKLFSDDDCQVAKHTQFFSCDDQDLYSVIDNLFNHV